jgi:hypothetical protein
MASATRLEADTWRDLVNRWHATAVRTMNEHAAASDGTCSRCGEQWTCPAVQGAALALDVDADV